MEMLSFNYDGYSRIVEPHTYGITKTGKETLRVYQVKGGHASGHSEPWHLFTVSKMIGLKAAGQSFPSPRADYNRSDSAMQTIYAQL
jgi:hypothetical protein